MTSKYSNSDYARILIEDWCESIRSEILKYDVSLLNERCPFLLPFLDGNYRGESGASEEMIYMIEKKLNVELPKDYRAFVQLTNRWPAPGLGPPGSAFLDIKEIGLYRDLYPSSYKIWMNDQMSVDQYEQIGIYGAEQLPECFCLQHLSDCVAISTQDGGESYVLNPHVRNGDSWEAWWIGFHLPGAMRFSSFFSLLEYEIPRSIADFKSLLEF